MVAVLAGAGLLRTGQAAEAGREALPAWLAGKEEVTVAVTDSGLGGLAIAADLAARLETARVAKRVRLVFFNALFANDSGYNSLPNRPAKLRVFDRALRALEEKVRPDLIVIGCNTLSVIYPDTAFARRTRVPVQGIVEPGVTLFRRELARHPGARLVLFGTETTIAEDSHRAALLAAGVPANRLVAKACPELASYIETNWQGDDTELMIAAMVGDALGGGPEPRAPVLAGLVCSHYGYAREAWVRAMAENRVPLAGVLDPNRELAETIVPSGCRGEFAATTVTAEVWSMVEVSPAKRRTLGTWLARVSPAVARALEDHAVRPGLFEWRD
ncbi:MAG: aspartate/glutamate racemase family protein [Verrucomicrobia bacterium]|nr:aspartate/glutamate racemase family protein [Verrucomicrobiota bacterium]